MRKYLHRTLKKGRELFLNNWIGGVVLLLLGAGVASPSTNWACLALAFVMWTTDQFISLIEQAS
jgi:hypothetical protein